MASPPPAPPAPSAQLGPRRRISVREIVALLDGWQYGSPTPAYRALADRIRLSVLDGRLPVHAVLPSERSLAAATGTSRTTTTAAYQVLRENGFAVAGHGSGTWTTLPGEDFASGDGVTGDGRGADAAAMPWPVTTTGSRGSADGRGDLASAAPEAPSQVYAAYAAALAELPKYLPGHGYVTAGLPALRARIADRYAVRGLPTQPEQIMVTAGAMHGLRLVLSLLIEAGDRVICEHPTYPLSLDAVRRAGARPIGLDVDVTDSSATAWDPEVLDSLLTATRAAAAYLMPDFQNPTGRLMPTDRRAAVAEVLARHGCVAIIDETTAELDLREASPLPAPFAAFSADAISLGSASKTFWGGLRIGWVRADPALIRRLAVARSTDDLGSPLVEQLACGQLLDACEDVLAERRATLRARRDALAAALAGELPTWSVPTPDGGMVAWCGLPEARSSRLAGAARALGVALTPGPRFAVGGGFEDRVRLPFARPEAELIAAVHLLGRAWRGEAAPLEAAADAVL